MSKNRKKKKEQEEVSVEETELSEENSSTDDKKNAEKKKKKRRSILAFTCVIALGAVSGTAIGLWLRGRALSQRRDFNEDEYKDDFSAILKKYEDVQDKESTNFTEILSPVEMIQVAFHLLSETNYISEGVGVLTNSYSGDQLITSIKGKMDDVYYFETISKGKMVNLGRRYFQQGENITYYNYDTLEKSETSDIVHATYKDKQLEMTKEDYKATFGSYLSDTTDYLFSSKTVFTGTTPTANATADGYDIQIRFSEDATETYKTRIIAMDSKVSNVPSFAYVDIHCTMDKQLRLKTFDITEEYTVLALGVVTAKCNGTLNSKYYYAEDGLTNSWLPTSIEAYYFQEEKQ